MSDNKHPKSTPANRPTQGDLERKPGIGQPKGTFATGEDPEILEGVNTSEGDTDHEASPLGGVSSNTQRENRQRKSVKPFRASPLQGPLCGCAT